MRSGFKTKKYIENLKNAEDAPMTGLKVAKRVSLIFTGVKTLIVPNFTLLGALISEWSNRSKV